MPTVIFSAHEISQRTPHGGVVIKLDIGRVNPLPQESVAIVRAADVAAPLARYIERITATGRPAQITCRFDTRSGRRPPGLKALEERQHTVNLDKAPQR